MPVRAQSSPERALETLGRAIVTADAVLVPLPAEVVCGPKVEGIVLSPKRDYALITRRSVSPARDLESYLAQSKEAYRSVREGDAGTPELQLLLWRSGSRRAVTVWRWTPNATYALASIDKVSWLAGSDTALVQIALVPRPASSEPGKKLSEYDKTRQTQIIRIHAATGQLETVATVNGYFFVGASYTTPTAIGSADNGKTVYAIGERGPMNRLAQFALGDDPRRQAVWAWPLADGRIGGLMQDVDDDGKSKWRKVAWNLKTNAIDDWDEAKNPEPTLPPPPPLPFTVTRTSDTLKAATDTPVAPLWLQARDTATSKRVLLTADSDAQSQAVSLETAIFYQQQGTLFAVPLVRTKPADFAALRREQDKQETLKRAKTIGTLALVATLQSKRLPEPSDFISLMQAYANVGPAQPHLLENPATGKPGLTVAYANPDLPTQDNARSQILGYLAGPSGRAVIYYGGDAKWEDSPEQRLSPTP